MPSTRQFGYLSSILRILPPPPQPTSNMHSPSVGGHTVKTQLLKGACPLFMVFTIFAPNFPSGFLQLARNFCRILIFLASPFHSGQFYPFTLIILLETNFRALSFTINMNRRKLHVVLAYISNPILERSLPPVHIQPAFSVGSFAPIILNKVDLPAPLSPSTVTNSLQSNSGLAPLIPIANMSSESYIFPMLSSFNYISHSSFACANHGVENKFAYANTPS